MELLIEKIFAFVFILIGLSHALHPAPWVDFFSWLKTKSFGAFIVIIYTLPVAVVIVAFHNDWQLKPSLFITLAGWTMLVKCLIYAVYPASFVKVINKGSLKRSLVVVGIFFIIASIAMLADIYLL